MTATIAVLIPTRNRASLAINAARSLLDQDCPLQIFISDNSTSDAELRRFCSEEPRVTYLRPSSELSMPEHWDWAMRQILDHSSATHVSVHYDRKFSKPEHWPSAHEVASAFDDTLITYVADFVSDQPPPTRLWQTTWTGKCFRLQTARVAAFIAAGEVDRIAHALPILSNCIIPRSILAAIIDRFGNICNSTGPDSAFMARFLVLNDSYLHFDRPLGILYASHRSNGLGYLRGRGGDFADFQKTFGDKPWLDAAPVPGINLGQNMLYHEYEVVRRETGDRLPPLDRPKVLNSVAAGLTWVADRETKNALRHILREQGWNGPEPEPFPPHLARYTMWQVLAMIRTWLRRQTPPHITGYRFLSDRQALHYGLKYPRKPDDRPDHLSALDPLEVDLTTFRQREVSAK